jgi:hypothetical protein
VRLNVTVVCALCSEKLRIAVNDGVGPYDNEFALMAVPHRCRTSTLEEIGYTDEEIAKWPNLQKWSEIHPRFAR